MTSEQRAINFNFQFGQISLKCLAIAESIRPLAGGVPYKTDELRGI